MRLIFGVCAVIGLCGAVLNCVGDDPTTPASSGGTDDGGGDVGNVGEGGPSEAGGALIDVNGTLNGTPTNSNSVSPLANRDVVIIDANDNVTKTTSGADGKFSAKRVATPYDIAIPYVPVDAASGVFPRYFAGITRPDPVVLGLGYNAAPTSVARSSMVTVTVNACNGCVLWFSSTGGDPSYDTATTGTGSAKMYTTNYQWEGAATLSSAFHVYIANSGPGTFVGYADIPATTLTDGVPTSLGTPTIQTLSGGTTITVNGAIPSGYTMPRTDIDLFHPDGSRVVSRSFQAASGMVNLPALGALIVRSESSATGPSSSDANSSQRQTVSSAANLNFTVLPAPTLLTPAEQMGGVTDAQSLSWSAFGVPTVYTVLIYASNSNWVIETPATGFALNNLTKAGMPLAGATKYTWQLSTQSLGSIDDLLGASPPDPGTAVVSVSDSFSQTFTTQ